MRHFRGAVWTRLPRGTGRVRYNTSGEHCRRPLSVVFCWLSVSGALLVFACLNHVALIGAPAVFRKNSREFGGSGVQGKSGSLVVGFGVPLLKERCEERELFLFDHFCTLVCAKPVQGFVTVPAF